MLVYAVRSACHKPSDSSRAIISVAALSYFLDERASCPSPSAKTGPAAERYIRELRRRHLNSLDDPNDLDGSSEAAGSGGKLTRQDLDVLVASLYCERIM